MGHAGISSDGGRGTLSPRERAGVRGKETPELERGSGIFNVAPAPGSETRDWIGVRPSPGAAGTELSGTLAYCETPLFAEVAAPGDGRTPVVPARCAPVSLDFMELVAFTAHDKTIWARPRPPKSPPSPPRRNYCTFGNVVSRLPAPSFPWRPNWTGRRNLPMKNGC